jgi:hypothetical protein
MAPFRRPIERYRVAQKSRLIAGPLLHHLAGGQELELSVEIEGADQRPELGRNGLVCVVCSRRPFGSQHHWWTEG